jgi:hypothetical protein
VLPGNRVRVESFYSTRDPAVEAIVRVYRPSGELLLSAGVTDEHGIYEFTWAKPEDLKVTVSQDGHRKEITIPAAELVDPAPNATGESRSHLSEILAGLSLILAVAAFVLSVRTASRLKRELTGRASVSERPPDKPHPATPPTVPTPR